MTTNLERIRQMTVDELQEYLRLNCSTCAYTLGSIDCYEGSCEQGVQKWLEQEVEEYE